MSIYKMEVFKFGSNIAEKTFTDQSIGRAYLTLLKEKHTVKEWFLHSGQVGEFVINDGTLIPYLGDEQCYWIDENGKQCENKGLYDSGYCPECEAPRNLKNGAFHPPYQSVMTQRGNQYPMSSIEYYIYGDKGKKTFAGLVYHVNGVSAERWSSGKQHLRKKKYGG